MKPHLIAAVFQLVSLSFVYAPESGGGAKFHVFLPNVLLLRENLFRNRRTGAKLPDYFASLQAALL